LMDLNRLLSGEYDSFPVKAGDLSLLERVRFVITLDADTEMPRGSAQRLIGTLAHPLNQAIIDPEKNIVIAGYGILQPRVRVSVQSASSSRLANIYSGQTGMDITPTPFPTCIRTFIVKEFSPAKVFTKSPLCSGFWSTASPRMPFSVTI